MTEIMVFQCQLLTVVKNISYKGQKQHYFSHMKTRNWNILIENVGTNDISIQSYELVMNNVSLLTLVTLIKILNQLNQLLTKTE